MKVKVKIGGREEEIEVVRRGELLRITRGGQTTEARLLHRDGLHFVLEHESDDGRRLLRKRIRAAGLADGDRRQLWVNGRLLTYERLRERSAAAAAGPAASSLSATIPAVVADVLVQPGDRVTAGQKLILLESMKMVIPIQAPYDGTVAQLNCATGDAVQPGVQLVEIEANDE